MKRNDLTKEILEQYFHYNPKEGTLYWKPRAGNPGGFNSRWAGKQAGSKDSKGYYVVKLNCKEFSGNIKIHSIIFFLETGEWCDLIDHKDINPSNNIFNNLRKSNKKKNALNQNTRSTNTTGYTNISIQNNRFVVQKSINGTRFFKRFDSLEEAVRYRDTLLEEANLYVNDF